MKSKTDLMRQLRARRKAEGLICRQIWITDTPEAKAALKRLEKRYGPTNQKGK